MAPFNGLSTTMLPMTVPGIYGRLDAAVKTGKMLLIGGMVVSGVPVSTFPATANGPFTEATEEAMKYYAVTLPTANIVVKENDRVEVFD